MNALQASIGWLDLVATVILAGGIAYGAAVASPHAIGRRLMRLSVGVLALALLLQIALNALRMHQISGIGGIALAKDVLDMRWSHFWMLRAAGLAALGLALSFSRPPWQALAPVAAAWLMTRSFQGHAGAHGSVPGLVDWLHLMAAAAWLGSLLQLVCAANDPTVESATRVRRLATTSALIALPTGIYAACLHVPSFDALLATSYGRVLTFKLLAAGALMTLGATNHFFHVPALARSDVTGAPRLINTVRRELWIGGAILFLTALLGVLPMPHVVEP